VLCASSNGYIGTLLALSPLSRAARELRRLRAAVHFVWWAGNLLFPAVPVRLMATTPATSSAGRNVLLSWQLIGLLVIAV